MAQPTWEHVEGLNTIAIGVDLPAGAHRVVCLRQKSGDIWTDRWTILIETKDGQVLDGQTLEPWEDA